MEEMQNKIMGPNGRNSAKDTFSNIFLVANPLVWYYTVSVMLQDALTKTTPDSSVSLCIWAIHYLGIILSAGIGAALAKKFDQKIFLSFWMILGTISSLTIFLIYTPNILYLGLISLILGISLGLGMPTCMGCFTSNTPIEKRGKNSGAIILAFMLGMLAMVFLPYDPLLVGGILSLWRLLSLLVFQLQKPTNKIMTQNRENIVSSYKSILKQKSFILYFIPFLMFALVNYLPTQIQSNLGGELATNLVLAQNVLIGVFAIVGGFLLDTTGRKRIAVIGFVMIGLSTAAIGIFPQNTLSWYFSAISGGVAWGFVYVAFVLTIWGDLSDMLGNTRSDKFYALGVTPFFVSRFLEIALGTSIAETVSETALFSFVTLFLFVAVLPLFYAPETLPEKSMKDRDIKSYLEKAKKIAEKETNKKQRKENTNKKTKPQEKEKTKEYEEAKKLAEKYY
jgi:MFS family permease